MKDFNAALEAFIANVQARSDAKFDKNFPNLNKNVYFLHGGRKYKKIAVKMCNGQTSVHSFVNVENGDIYKAASWKAPALNAARGNIFFNNGDDALTADGYVRYL